MDIFKEFIVKKELSRSERISKIFIMIACIALAFAFLLATITTTIATIGILLAGVSIYVGYRLITKMFVEYEYILTNSDLDIDKIVNQSTRSRLCTLSLKDVTEYGIYSENVQPNENETIIKASANNPELKDYYLRFKHKSLGEAFLLFTPSTELFELARPLIPRNAKVNM